MPNQLDTTDGPAGANRFERRRARTRQALIAAARQILAETGETSASIQEIAARADVGFGTFYNHFETKNDLFDAAVGDALEEYGQLLDSVTEGIDDPAAVFAARVRLTLRLAASHPEITQILRLRGLPHINAATGLGPRALRDLEIGKASGRFTFEDPLVARSAVGGALIGLLQLNSTRDLDAEAGEHMAEMILRMLGLPADEAHGIATRPLPDLP
ncbi:MULTISPECIES: TetR/AcrR family transcriptional regulator [Streptomyces]|uniref:TetR/AcrR family transcriptional regulator n=1 Tax=Streptomyces morookaense TaxID=1970 RepID=A0A7Y7EAE2_STRMO|nr:MULTISPECIES: TetR/AcrR family transcriptional regulator [Streptomyces]MCC2273866.1 TetR/AcrR family transcriptional regulator [Streptomyces sp. ET3-23]NVK82035.1 TetR/AcrR family transcriptional regulator [Streptomyces morookaense]GHF34215.1 putative TetR-family transcriptional regulator [Streptomyces morookaense]